MATRVAVRRELRRPPPQNPTASLAQMQQLAERRVDAMLAGMAERIRSRVAELDDGSGQPMTEQQLDQMNQIVDQEMEKVYGRNRRSRSALLQLIETEIRACRQVAVDPAVRRIAEAVGSDPELATFLKLPDLSQG